MYTLHQKCTPVARTLLVQSAPKVYQGAPQEQIFAMHFSYTFGANCTNSVPDSKRFLHTFGAKCTKSVRTLLVQSAPKVYLSATAFCALLVHFAPKVYVHFWCRAHQKCTSARRKISPSALKAHAARCTFGALCTESVRALLVQSAPKVYQSAPQNLA